MSKEYPNEGYDEWIDALGAGEGYYLGCPDGHWSLPPRRLCPECGAGGLTQRPLADTGEVETFTVTQVASPRFEDDAPYVTAIASFDDVRLTGQLRGLVPEEVAVGTAVSVGVESSETSADPIVVFRPA